MPTEASGESPLGVTGPTTEIASFWKDGCPTGLAVVSR